jgi:hypothetical protein
VAQVALVVRPPAGHAPAQAQLLEERLHLPRGVAGHRQVVRAERAGDALHAAAAAVAPGRGLRVEQGEVLDAVQAQGARRRQPRDAAARDEHLRAAAGARRGPLPRLAQEVAGRGVGADEAAGRVRRRVAARRRHGACRQQRAAADHGCTFPHSRS